MNRKWSFLINPFLVAGTKNYKRAYELAKFTDAALSSRIADPFFVALVATFHPLFAALETAYNNWKSQGGIQEGATYSLDQLLAQLAFGDDDMGITSKINDWSLAVQNVFRKGTPSYLAIFPDGNAPFQTGSKDSRISAVAALSVTLGGIPALAALKVTVDAFLASLNAARVAQQGQLSGTGSDSDEVRAAMTAAMVGMFAVYGALIQQYAATPDDVEAFFNMELLRALPQSVWNGTIEMMETKNVVKRTLADNRKVKLTVETARELIFFVANEKNDVDRTNFINVPGLEERTITWGSIKNSSASTFLNVYNGAFDVEGKYKIEILPEGES